MTTELDFSFLEFRFSSEQPTKQEKPENLSSQFLSILNDATQGHWRNDNENDVLTNPLGDVGYFSTYTNEKGGHVVLRYYVSARLGTIDVQELKKDTYFTHAVVDKLFDLLKQRLDVIPLRQYLSIPRVSQVPQLYPTSDERVMVYDFDRILCDVFSDYQHIKILHSVQFGNTLILDDFVNLAEKDLVYTHQLMWKGKISYAGKNVLVLGGGDGGVLNEVLKENPNFVTMIEIDETVMKMCRKYLRGACGDCLDSMKGLKHEIIVDDCFAQLQKFIDAGRRFDVVFSDLTDVPLVREGESKRGEFWSLMRRAIEMGLKVMKTDGQFLTHLVGLSASDVINQYEKMLNDWPIPLKFERAETMVPSFLEIWTFYRIRLQ